MPQGGGRGGGGKFVANINVHLLHVPRTRSRCSCMVANDVEGLLTIQKQQMGSWFSRFILSVIGFSGSVLVFLSVISNTHVYIVTQLRQQVDCQSNLLCV